MRTKDWFRQLTTRQRVLYTGLMVLAILPLVPVIFINALLTVFRELVRGVFMVVVKAQLCFGKLFDDPAESYLTKTASIVLSFSKKF